MPGARRTCAGWVGPRRGRGGWLRRRCAHGGGPGTRRARRQHGGSSRCMATSLQDSDEPVPRLWHSVGHVARMVAGCCLDRFGPEFSFSNPSYGIFGGSGNEDDVPEAEDKVPVPAPKSSYRRGRGGGGGGRRGGGRTAGRGGRPPIPAASVDVDADLNNASVADWQDENKNRIVCELFAEECKFGNRSSTQLNKAGYKNIIKKFQERTSVVYMRLQFKNKWDRLKSDYGIWKQLTKQTGLGWDESHKNIVMPNDWWKRTMATIKGSGRFKEKCLQHEEHLVVMFEDLRNTDDDHWSASSGVTPS